MKIEFITKNFRLFDKDKEYYEKKLEKLDKFIADDVVCKLILQHVHSTKYIMECKIILDNNKVLRATYESKEMRDNIDFIIPKLEGQIRKIKTLNLKKIKSSSIEELENQKNIEEIKELKRTKTIVLSKISVDEAIHELDIQDRNFYVFLNDKTGLINIVYRRNDGKSGLIDLVY